MKDLLDIDSWDKGFGWSGNTTVNRDQIMRSNSRRDRVCRALGLKARHNSDRNTVRAWGGTVKWTHCRSRYTGLG